MLRRGFPSAASNIPARRINRLGNTYTLQQRIQQSFNNEYVDMDPVARAVYDKIAAESISKKLAKELEVIEEPECATFRRKTKKPDKNFLDELRTKIINK